MIPFASPLRIDPDRAGDRTEESAGDRHVIALLSLAILLSLSALRPAHAEEEPPIEAALATITRPELIDHVVTLSSPRFEGRLVGSRGGYLASEYIAHEFARLGLEPGVKGRSYFQRVPLSQGVQAFPLEEVNRLRLGIGAHDRRAVELRFGDEFVAERAAPDGWLDGPVVVLPADLPATGDLPANLDGCTIWRWVENDVVTTPGTSAANVALVARLRSAGARAVLFVPAGEGAALPPDQKRPKAEAPLAIPAVRLSSKGRDRLLERVGEVPRDRVARLPNVVLDGRVVRRAPLLGMGRNVLAILRGSDPELADEAVVVGGHFDHVGYGETKRLTRGTVGALHPGADDNGSGCAGLVEVAEAFVLGGITPARTVIFVAFDGEEVGLLGSKQFVRESPWPVEKIVAMVNFDMVSRNETDLLYFVASPDYPKFNATVESTAGRAGFRLVTDGMKKYLRRSDHWPFLRRGIPSCFFFGGLHDDYHTERDDVWDATGRWLVNRDKLEAVARFMFRLTHACANHPGRFVEASLPTPR